MFSSLLQRLPAVASVLSPGSNVGLPGSGTLSRSLWPSHHCRANARSPSFTNAVALRRRTSIRCDPRPANVPNSLSQGNSAAVGVGNAAVAAGGEVVSNSRYLALSGLRGKLSHMMRRLAFRIGVVLFLLSSRQRRLTGSHNFIPRPISGTGIQPGALPPVSDLHAGESRWRTASPPSC